VLLTLPKAPGDWPADAAAPRALLLPAPVSWDALPALPAGQRGADIMELGRMLPVAAMARWVGRPCRRPGPLHA
jgi:hypothetical protein